MALPHLSVLLLPLPALTTTMRAGPQRLVVWIVDSASRVVALSSSPVSVVVSEHGPFELGWSPLLSGLDKPPASGKQPAALMPFGLLFLARSTTQLLSV